MRVTDPETGAAQYNENALRKAQADGNNAVCDEVGSSVDWALKTPGAAARALAADLAAAFQGDYQFRMEDLNHWDEDTKSIRAGLVFRKAALRELPARQVMALRVRAAQP